MFPRVEACCADFDEGPVPMTPLKRLAAGAAVAALMAGATACTKDDPAAAPTSTPATTSATPTASLVVTPSPTVTPTPKPTLSQRAQADADAIARMKEYYAVTDRLNQRPGTKKNSDARLKGVAIATELVYSVESIDSFRASGLHQTGTVRLDNIKIESTKLEFQPKAKRPVIPTVAVNLCVIESGIDIIDRTGKSHVAAGRLPRIVTHVSVSNYSWPSRNGWRVSSYTTEDKAC